MSLEKPMELTKLPGLNCGQCGYPTCDQLLDKLTLKPNLLDRCIHAKIDHKPVRLTHETHQSIAHCTSESNEPSRTQPRNVKTVWKDSLDRDIDFYLDRFPEDPGPREIIIPHNPMLTRELDILKDDILIGRPLGMSCGCPITHCGIVMNVDRRTGVLAWCVTGPLNPRQKGYKDIGYYIAEGYEGIVTQTRVDITVGKRYFFQPTLCMLQWRHSGLVNYLNKIANGFQVRLEGLWIG
jgi:uncharacterized Fe-S cluster-containing protein